MSDRVTIEEQEEMGLRRPRAIAPYVAPPPAVRRMSAEESAALQGLTPGQAQPLAQQPIQLPAWEGTHTGHVRQQDDAITNAKASLLYSKAIILVVSIGITAILFLAYLNYGGEIGIYFGIELLALSSAALLALLHNRHQGLHHSATGIAHAEIKAKGQMFATQAEVEKYRIDADKEVKLAEVAVRRELGSELVKRLGEDKS